MSWQKNSSLLKQDCSWFNTVSLKSSLAHSIFRFCFGASLHCHHCFVHGETNCFSHGLAFQWSSLPHDDLLFPFTQWQCSKPFDFWTTSLKRGFAWGLLQFVNFLADLHCVKTAHAAVSNWTSSTESQKCCIQIHVKTCQHKCTRNWSTTDISNKCFQFSCTWKEIWVCLSKDVAPGFKLKQCACKMSPLNVTPGLHGPGRGGVTHEARKRADWPCDTMWSPSSMMLWCTPLWIELLWRTILELS